MSIQRVASKYYTVSQKNDNDVAYYNFNAHKPILVIFFAQMLLSEYTIKWWFVIPPPLASVSALPGETWTQKFGLSVMLYTKNNTDFLAISSTFVNLF